MNSFRESGILYIYSMEVLVKYEDNSGFLIEYKEENKDSCPMFTVYESADVEQEAIPTDKYLEGMIKWDGCSHILVGPDEGYLHLCGYKKWKEFSDVMEAVWKKSVALIDNFDYECADYILGESPDPVRDKAQEEYIKAQSPKDFEKFKDELNDFLSASKLSDFKAENTVFPPHWLGNEVRTTKNDKIQKDYLETLNTILIYGSLRKKDVIDLMGRLKIFQPVDNRKSKIIELSNKGNSADCIYNMLKDE